MTKVSRGQHDSFLLCCARGPNIIVLSDSTTHRVEIVSTGEGCPHFPPGFHDSLMARETSSTWQDGQQEDFRRSSCRRGFIHMRIELYLHGPIIIVHGMDYSVGQIHEHLDGVLHCQYSLLIGSKQRGPNTIIWQDNELRRGSPH